VLRSIKNVLQLLGFTEKHQGRSVALGLCELPSSAKMQSIEEWDLPRSIENVLPIRRGKGPAMSRRISLSCGYSSESAAGCSPCFPPMVRPR
jgi:hypothetical protein